MRSTELTLWVEGSPSLLQYARAFEGTAMTVTPDERTAQKAQRLLVFTSDACLSDVKSLVSSANTRHQLCGLLIHAPEYPHWIPRLLSDANLSTLRRTHVCRDHAVFERLLKALSMDAAAESIADATYSNGELRVVGCDFASHRIRVNGIRALAEMLDAELRDFVIADDGGYLHWPASDVHLTLTDLVASADPTRALAVQRGRIQHDQAFGRAVRHVREAHALTQDAIQDISTRQLRRIERGEVGGSLSDRALVSLAAAHGLTPEQYLDEVIDYMHSAAEAPAIEA